MRSHFGWLNSSNLTFAIVKLEEHLSIEWSWSDGWRRMKLQKYGFSCAVTISLKAFQPADQFEWNIGDRSNFWLKPSKTHVASGISSSCLNAKLIPPIKTVNSSVNKWIFFSSLIMLKVYSKYWPPVAGHFTQYMVRQNVRAPGVPSK